MSMSLLQKKQLKVKGGWKKNLEFSMIEEVTRFMKLENEKYLTE